MKYMAHLAIAVLIVCAADLSATVNTPVLSWMHGGCYSSWCETGWYSSPAVADLSGDGKREVVAGGYTINILRGSDGQVLASFNKNGSRVWSGIIVADINADGKQEIVAASGGNIIVRNNDGDTLWTKQIVSAELRGIAAADLDGTGKLRLIATQAALDSLNTWVCSYDGTIMPGWPQRSKNKGYDAGVYNDNAAIGDLSGSGTPEIVVPSDVHYICAYTPAGVPVPASSIFGTKVWGEVGAWVDTAPELRGYGLCDGTPVESYRANFADGAAVIADVNNDGAYELVAAGDVYDCSGTYPPSKYTGLFIFNADRTRFKKGGYDWSIPFASGAPLSEDYNVIESCMPDPVVADLNGDGLKEILFSSYDGKVHAVSLDKTEHGNWPFAVYHAGDPFFRFASPPVVADLDNDGRAEVLFTTWTQEGSHTAGDLFILDNQANVLQKIALPDTFGGANWNGAMASPTLDRIDTSGDLSIVINTSSSGIVAYRLPGTKNATVLWGTGRGNYRRDGFVPIATAAARPLPGMGSARAETHNGMIRCRIGGEARMLAVKVNIDKGFAAEVVDARGRTIRSLVDKGELEIMTDRAGVYFVKVTGNEGMGSEVGKVMR